ncbi:putative NADPH oxidase [Bisporella sp. PMI_857]|nr:putative NADPH oxidase [Bisporella sp. PMI_857]
MSEQIEGSAETEVSKSQKYHVFSSWTWKSFVFITIFHAFHISLFLYGWSTIVNSGASLPGLSKLKYSVLISRAAALPLSLDLLFLLLPMCRITTTQLRLLIKWTPLEEAVWFHRQVAYTLLFYTVVHTASHYVNFFLIERDQLRPEKAMQIHYTQAAGITGHVMIFCMVIIYTFAHEKIRKQSFEAFQWGHRLFLVFLIAAWTHGSGCFVRDTIEPYDITEPRKFWAHCVGYQSWRWESWFSVLYILERVYAHCYCQRRVNVSKVLQHPSNVLEIQFDRATMNYKAGQWIFIKCPWVSKTQWHPFSISSCPYDTYVSVHIRQVGDFTKALRDVFDNRINPAYDMADFDPSLRTTSIIHARLQAQETPEILVEGPYGSPAEDIFGNEVAVLIGAGIGVTPWASVLKSLWHLRDPRFAKEGHRLKRVEFIWTCKDLTMFEWFQNLITSLNEQSLALEDSDKSIRLSCHTYITRRDVASSSGSGYDMGSSKSKNPVLLQDLLKRANTATRARRQNNIHTGRPNFNKIFRRIRESLEIAQEEGSLSGRLRGRNQIGVSFCGPKPMAHDIRLACAEMTTKDIKFRFKKETF